MKFILLLVILPLVFFAQEAQKSWLSTAQQHTRFGTAAKTERGEMTCRFHEHRSSGSKPMVRQLVQGSLAINADGTCRADFLEAETDTPVMPQYSEGDTMEERTVTEPRISDSNLNKNPAPSASRTK
jgi:hypothetical protein